jgi:hypothetical protein
VQADRKMERASSLERQRKENPEKGEIEQRRQKSPRVRERREDLAKGFKAGGPLDSLLQVMRLLQQKEKSAKNSAPQSGGGKSMISTERGEECAAENEFRNESQRKRAENEVFEVRNKARGILRIENANIEATRTAASSRKEIKPQAAPCTPSPK